MAFQSIKISTRSRGKKPQTHLVAHPVGAPVIQPEGGNLIEVSFTIYHFPQLFFGTLITGLSMEDEVNKRSEKFFSCDHALHSHYHSV